MLPPSRPLLVIACQIFLASAALAVVGCSERVKPVGRGSLGVAPVLVGQVQRKPVPLLLDAVGAVEPIRTAAVRSQVTGTSVKVCFQEGQDVQQGDLLFEIDPRPFRNTLNSAEADLQKVRAQLENSRLQLARYTALSTGAMVSKEQFQTVQSNERVLAAQLAASESAVANARLQLENCSIRAPISGRTGSVGAHEGDLIRASDATISLVTVHQLSPINVTFGVSQQHLATLAQYRAAGSIAVTVVPPGSDSTPEKGELTFVDNNIDAATGTLKLKATFPNATHRLWPGQFVSLRVILATPDALVVPSAAVQSSQKGQHVFVVKADKTAELRPITLERAGEQDSVVASGLTEGESVVVDGQLRVVSGKPVEVREANATSPAPRSKKKRATE